MKIRFLLLLAAGLAVGVRAMAQDADNPPAPPQNQTAPGQGPGGSRGGGRGFGAFMGGRGVLGTVVEVAPDHYTIKTDSGELRTVNFSVNTRIMKQPPQRSNDGGRTPPEAIKATDIKVGDAIAASGELDASGKSVGAVLVVQLDPERARQMREMQANFGKTWLMGRILAIHETKITLQSPVDNSVHTFVADENTSFHRRRDFITLGDVQVGESVRVEGAVKEGVFMATAVNVMPVPPATEGPIPPHDQVPR